MQFFKHYHNASSSIKLQQLIHKGGAEAYGLYWLLLEILCEKFDGIDPDIELFAGELARKLGVRSDKVSTFLQLCDKFALISVQVEELIYKVHCPILLELQDRDFKRARKDRATKAPKNKIKNKDKELRDKNKKPEFGLHEKLHDEFLLPYFEKVKLKTQEGWFQLYPDTNWIKTELVKAVNWLITSDAIRKDKGRFFTNWLQNAVEFQSRQATRYQDKGQASKTGQDYLSRMMAAYEAKEVANG